MLTSKNLIKFNICSSEKDGGRVSNRKEYVTPAITQIKIYKMRARECFITFYNVTNVNEI